VCSTSWKASAKRYKLPHDKAASSPIMSARFGSKGALGVETIARFELARAAKAPVRVAYDREESFR